MPPLNTATIGMAVTPTVVSTLFSHVSLFLSFNSTYKRSLEYLHNHPVFHFYLRSTTGRNGL